VQAEGQYVGSQQQQPPPQNARANPFAFSQRAEEPADLNNFGALGVRYFELPAASGGHAKLLATRSTARLLRLASAALQSVPAIGCATEFAAHNVRRPRCERSERPEADE